MSVAGDHRRGEDEAPRPRRTARLDQPPGPLHVDLGDSALVALGGDLRGEVDDAVRPGGLERPGHRVRVAEVAARGGGARRLGAETPDKGRDLMPAGA